MTICSPRWPCCPPLSLGALSISAAARWLDALRRQAERLGLSARIEWRGAQAQPEVLAGYRDADLFVLAAKVARDGDRDGLPNVLMEAQSQRLACIATDVSAIPELIQHLVTGMLVPPDNPRALACALEALISDPARRSALAIAGELRVRGSFAAGSAIDALAKRFGLHPPARASGSPPGRIWDGSLTAEALSQPSRVASVGIL